MDFDINHRPTSDVRFVRCSQFSPDLLAQAQRVHAQLCRRVYCPRLRAHHSRAVTPVRINTKLSDLHIFLQTEEISPLTTARSPSGSSIHERVEDLQKTIQDKYGAQVKTIKQKCMLIKRRPNLSAESVDVLRSWFQVVISTARSPLHSLKSCHEPTGKVPVLGLQPWR
jgi:hypothetical protein